MNSIVTLNWVDKDFAQRVLYNLERQRYIRLEDYESVGAHIQVWEKEAGDNQRGVIVGSNPLAPIRYLPKDAMVAAIKDRLATYMPVGSKDWEVEHAATNLIFDLMGKPG